MTTKERVIKIISDKSGFEPEEIKDESILDDDLGLDSLDAIELLMELETEFNVPIPDEKFHPVTTVAHVIEAVESCLPGSFQNVHPQTNRGY